jgi:hypothetical protein
MTISRRELYAAGEPFGDCATQRKPCGGYLCGGGSSSSSSAQTTNNTDKRLVTGEGSVGISSENSEISVNVESIDGALVARALDSIDKNNAILGEGLDQLFTKGEGLIGTTQKAVADAYSMAQTDAKGTIDNRTITVLAVAGVAALWAFNRGNK